jgi:hypothetical protein
MAVEFNGTDQDISCGSFTGPTNGSVCFWMLSDLFDATQQRIFGTQGHWEGRMDTAEQMNNDLHGSTSLVGPTIILLNTYTHFVLTNATNSNQIFQNGVLDVSGTVTNQVPTAADLLLGWRTGGAAAEHFDGILEDVRIYNRVLSANEALTIYAAQGSDGIVDGLVHRWIMNEGASGTTVSGASSVRDIVDASQLHGTPTGTPVYREDFRTRWRRRAA